MVSVDSSGLQQGLTSCITLYLVSVVIDELTCEVKPLQRYVRSLVILGGGVPGR